MSNQERIATPEVSELENYVLTFRTVNGDLMAWCIRTNAQADEIPQLIESAANEWLLSPDGRKFIEDEELAEWGFDYWHALDKVPEDILSKHNIFLWTPIQSVVELEPDENLLPNELRK
jgi:hypothetical protein